MAFVHISRILVLVFLTSVKCQSDDVILLTFYAEEEVTGNQLLGNIADQVNTTDIHGWSFTINENDHSSYFNILDNSDLQLTELIDREAMCSSQVECKIRLDIYATSASTFIILYVDVIIVDKNDNRPTFTRGVLNLDIPEGTSMGTSYELPSALDPDMGNNSIQSYVLDPENDNFLLDTFQNLDGTSSLNLVLNLNLDRELQEKYQLYVLAIDGGDKPLTGLLTVNINVTDINDNRPVFNPAKYNKTINEDMSVDTEIVTVSATDRDIGENARLAYSITKMEPSSITDLIGIEQSTGRIFLLQPLNTATGPFTLYVEARDHGEPVKKSLQAEVKIYVRDINNNAPDISVNTLNSGKPNAKVVEHSAIGTLVALINVRDADTGLNGEAECTCENSTFSIQAGSSNTFSIHVAADFDREVLDTYYVLVNCSDKGEQPLFATEMFEVKIEDINDNNPSFTMAQYSQNVTENNNAGAVLLRVAAYDLDTGDNGRMTFSIEPASFRSKFSIDSISGVIKAVESFDREEEDLYTFTVIATDHGNTPKNDTATIVIRIKDLNDNWPVFNGDSYAMSVLENSNISKSIGQVTASDDDLGDNGKVSYMIPAEYSLYPFAVLDDGTVVTTKVLDREGVGNLYQFEIVASDHGSSPLSTRIPVHVTILDVNDNPPFIEFPYGDNDTVNIPHNTVPNTVIASVVAEDADEKENKRLTYSFYAGNGAGLFFINPDTGDISLTRQISEGETKQFTLTISVKDNGVRQLEAQAKLHMSIYMATDPHGIEGPLTSGQNILIAIVIACVTLVLSLIIIIIICVIRRKDRQSRLFNAKYDEQKIIATEGYRNSNRSSSSRGSQDKMLYPGDIRYVENGNGKRTRNKVSFSMEESRDTGISMDTNTDQFDHVSTFKSPSPTADQANDYENYQQKEMSPPRSEKSDDSRQREINRITSLRVHQALIQSNNNNKQQWPSNSQDEQLGRAYSGLGNRKTGTPHLDDTRSESSGETTTSDSGRGGSEEDIRSNMTISHDTDESRSPNTSTSHPFYTSETHPPQSFTSFHGGSNVVHHKTGPVLSSFLKKKQNRQNIDDKHSGHYPMNDLSNPHKSLNTNSVHNSNGYTPYPVAHSSNSDGDHSSPRNCSPRSTNNLPPGPGVEPGPHPPHFESPRFSSFGKVPKVNNNVNVSDRLLHLPKHLAMHPGNSYEESVTGMSQDDDNTTTTSGSFTLPDLSDDIMASEQKDRFYKTDTFV